MQDHLDDLLACFRSAGNRAEFADEPEQVDAMMSARSEPPRASTWTARLRGRFGAPSTVDVFG